MDNQLGLVDEVKVPWPAAYRQSSTMPSACASTTPRTRTVAAAKTISMQESEPMQGRDELGIGVVTGSNAAALGATPCVPAGLTSLYSLTHRRSRLAF
jgi:hypothetical protein